MYSLENQSIIIIIRNKPLPHTCTPVIDCSGDVVVEEAPGGVHIIPLDEVLEGAVPFPTHHPIHLLLAGVALLCGQEEVDHMFAPGGLQC
jgi:hypothetical protein